MSRHTKPQMTSSASRNSVPASSALDGLRKNVAVPLGTPLAPPPAPPARMPWDAQTDWHGATVLGCFAAIMRCRASSSQSIGDDFVPAPDWHAVTTSPWRRLTSFAAVAKRARGGGTASTIQGRDWAEARKLAENSKGQTIPEKMRLLVQSSLDGDALIATIAEMLADAA